MREPASEDLKEPSDQIGADMHAAFDRSAHECTVFDRTIEMAGRKVQLRLAGERIAAWIDPALSHLASKSRGSSPRLTIHLFPRNSNSTHDSGTAGRIWTAADGRFLRQRVGGCDYVLDRTERHVIGSICSMDEIPSWERAKPLSVPLTTWLSDDGLSVVHAGLVSLDGEGVLFAGPSGSGKSTCALACASGGFDFLGDDCLILDVTPRDCVGYSLYSTGSLDAAHLGRFASPTLLGATNGLASRGKELIALGGAAQVRTVWQSRIRAIVLPRLTHEPRSVIRPATKSESLRVLAPSSIVKRAVPASRTLAKLAALVNLVPSYWLDMSHNPSDIPDAIAPLIR